MIAHTALPGATGRLVTVRVEVPTDDDGFVVLEYKTRLVEASIETDEPDITDWLTSDWLPAFYAQPHHILKFTPEGPYYMTTLTPDTKPADDSWPYEHTETDDEKPSHRKPYRDKHDGEKAVAWRLAGRPPGRHA